MHYVAADNFEAHTDNSIELIHGGNSRKLLELQKDVALAIKKKNNSTISTVKNQIKTIKSNANGLSKNQTKTIKTTGSSSPKNQTKLLKTTIGSTKNQTKLLKNTINGSTKNQTKLQNLTTSTSPPKNKTKLTKPITNTNSPTIKTTTKKLNSTSKPSNSTKKSPDLIKPVKLTTKLELKSQKPNTQKQKTKNPIWVDEENEDDLVSEFRDLPSRFQETLLPDLDIISTTSKVYLNRANKEITNGFKPYVGKKYAPAIASIVSCAFILIPLILVSLIFHKIKAYFSLQRILIFIQIYLSIYFSILSLSALVTGLEPLRFFYATSQSTYVCIQVLQTLGYVLYLLLLLMYLILVFSTETGVVSKLLGLGQTFVGFAVGLHYYVTVFHRAVLHQPPKSSWKVHSIYATCFLVICALDRAERRKKAYLEEGGAEGKMS